ncbi:MAG: hypothetical protein ABJA61_03780 [Caldimonas sp.]
MTIGANPSAVLTLGIAALIAWRMVSRVRRMVGRQRLSRVRPWITVTLFPLLVALLLVASLGHPKGTLALAGGALAGAALGVLGLHLTKFEAGPAGLYYTPNAHLGIALSLLFVGRIIYRFVVPYFSADGFVAPPADFARSPLTLLIFGTLAGYYVAYAIGLLRWRHRVETAVPAASAEPPSGVGQ